MIRYLEQDEKGRTRELWNEAFAEDSVSFSDYYYREKMKDNRVLVFEREGQILSMLHRNPYRLWLRGAEVNCDFVVGVATKVSERGKGRMRSLILNMLRDMQDEKVPFTYLMPTRESLYTPYDFRFIYDKERYVLRYNKDMKRVPYKSGTMSEDLAEWQNAFLKKRYDVFAIRDAEYMDRMDLELASEGGEVRMVYDDDWFVGMESEWGLKERELRYLYSGERYCSSAGKKPAIMARIVCLPEFMKHIRLMEDCPHEKLILELGVNDLFVPQNQGAWLWKITKEGSELIQESRFISKKSKISVFTIAELTQWLFGYDVPLQVKTLPNWEYIDTFHTVLLDEIV